MARSVQRESRHQFDLTAYDADTNDLDEVLFTGTLDEAITRADQLARDNPGTVEVALLLNLSYKD